MDNQYYVYAHKKRTNGKIFYIGKGIGNRCFVKFGRNKHWHNVVNKHDYSIEIIKSSLSLMESLVLEKELIENLRNSGINLVNQTNGGDGYPGFVINDETREKFRNAKLGKKQKPAHAKKSAMARIGKKNTAWHIEKTVEGKRKKIINSSGICFISSCHAAKYLTEVLGKSCYQGLISMCARGIRNNAYGLTWSYDTSIVPEFKKTTTAEKRVLCKENNMTFDSVQKATEWISDKLGSANNQSISGAARSNGVRTAYGYHWEYL